MDIFEPNHPHLDENEDAAWLSYAQRCAKEGYLSSEESEHFLSTLEPKLGN